MCTGRSCSQRAADNTMPSARVAAKRNTGSIACQHCRSLLIPFMSLWVSCALAPFEQEGAWERTAAQLQPNPSDKFGINVPRPPYEAPHVEHTSRRPEARIRGSRRRFLETDSPLCAQVPSPETHRVAPCHGRMDVFTRPVGVGGGFSGIGGVMSDIRQGNVGGHDNKEPLAVVLRV